MFFYSTNHIFTLTQNVAVVCQAPQTYYSALCALNNVLVMPAVFLASGNCLWRLAMSTRARRVATSTAMIVFK